MNENNALLFIIIVLICTMIITIPIAYTYFPERKDTCTNDNSKKRVALCSTILFIFLTIDQIYGKSDLSKNNIYKFLQLASYIGLFVFIACLCYPVGNDPCDKNNYRNRVLVSLSSIFYCIFLILITFIISSMNVGLIKFGDKQISI